MIQFACDAFWTFIGVLCYAAAVVIAACTAKGICCILRNK